VVVAGLLVLLLVLADLTRRDSLIRSTWRTLTGRDTPMERVLDGIRDRT